MIGQSASQRSQARGLIMSWFVDCVTLHTGTLRGDIVLHCTLGYSGETYTTPSFNLGFLGETFQMKFFTPFELLKHILFSFLHCYVAVVTTQCTTVHCYGNIATPKLSTVHFYSDIATTKLSTVHCYIATVVTTSSYRPMTEPNLVKRNIHECFQTIRFILRYW